MRRLFPWLSLGVLLLLLRPALARAQSSAPISFRVDPVTSLAWWQIDPHMGHLWATTCPGDDEWSPGESRGAGWEDRGGDDGARKEVKVSAYHEERIPLYPRLTVEPVCAPAVSGEIVVDDPRSWAGVRGAVTVDPDALEMGFRMRTEYARKAVYQTAKYGKARFTIQRLDSVRVVGDTIYGRVAGTFTFRGVSEPMTAPVRAWPEPTGLRVQGQFGIPAAWLTRVYGVSRFAMGLGVGQRIWRSLVMGVDVILRQEG